MELSEDQIKEINEKCPYDQGIFKEGNGIPLHIKEYCVYSRYRSGYKPGSCWDDENTVNEYHPLSAPSDHFKVLDIVLSYLRPNITFLEHRMISGLIDNNTDTEYGYYGDFDEYTVEFIKLSDLYEALSKL